MGNINVIHHMNEIKKILSYSKNIGFFFGAGTSCAFGLPDIFTLTKEIVSKLDTDDKRIFENAEKSVGDLIGKASVSVEDILNYVRQIRNITNGRADLNYSGITGSDAKTLDREICSQIFKIISEKENIADVSNIRRFFAWYDSSNKGFIKEIFTTNYDMLLEMAMEANFIPYFDGFTGSFEPFFNPESIEAFPVTSDFTGNWIRLWKIHGSLNWILKEKTSNSAARIVRIGKIENPQNELMIYPSKDKYNLSRKEPYIAYFDRLKKYLQRGELLFICSGYSFSDQHINAIIFNSLRQNSRLYVLVFCFSDQQIEDMESYSSAYLNLCVMGPTKVINNGEIHQWLFDDAEDDAQGYEFYWEETEKKFSLGDFKKLINFFVENSGRKSTIEEIINGK